jgi:hypothetical protein
MPIILIAIFCADIATTWMLLTTYRGLVREGGLLASVLFKGSFYGHLIFVIVRICLLALVIQFMEFWGMVAWGGVTAFAVVNNCRILWRLNHG